MLQQNDYYQHFSGFDYWNESVKAATEQNSWDMQSESLLQ